MILYVAERWGVIAGLSNISITFAILGSTTNGSGTLLDDLAGTSPGLQDWWVIGTKGVGVDLAVELLWKGVGR